MAPQTTTMNKEQLAQLLQTNHTQFIQQLEVLKDDDFCYAPEGKWSAAQQLDHIVRSVSPVNMALGIPKFIVQWKFGMANRPSKSFDALIEKYNLKLSAGGKASGRFVPPTVTANKKEQLLARLNTLVVKLSAKTIKHSEDSLDKYILPHPLLGKLTFREMLYFTAYHVEHHGRLIEKALRKE